MAADSPDAEPADGAAYFGSEVLAARRHKGATQAELAEAVRYQVPYVSKVENGKLLASAQFARACDEFFETSGYFARLRQRATQQGHPRWFIPYLELEQQALTISNFSCVLVMGMLQTPEYAAAVFRAAYPREDEEQIKARVLRRKARFEVMNGENPPLLWLIITEGVLHAEVGGPAVMAEQCDHLLSAMQSPHVVLQVLPFSAGAPASSLTFIPIEDGGRSGDRLQRKSRIGTRGKQPRPGGTRQVRL